MDLKGSTSKGREGRKDGREGQGRKRRERRGRTSKARGKGRGKGEGCFLALSGVDAVVSELQVLWCAEQDVRCGRRSSTVRRR